MLNTKSGRAAFRTEFWAYLSDVAGAAGYMSSKGSIVLTESTYQRLVQVYKSVLVLADGTSDQALDAYVRWLGKWLDQEVESRMGKVVIRLASMMRLSKKQDAAVLRNALLDLSDGDKKTILEVFSFDWLPEGASTPTYIPAVLANLSKNQSLGGSFPDRVASTVQVGVVHLARALKQMMRESVEARSGGLILNFNPMAAQAKRTDAIKLFSGGAPTLRVDGSVRFVVE